MSTGRLLERQPLVVIRPEDRIGPGSGRDPGSGQGDHPLQHRPHRDAGSFIEADLGTNLTGAIEVDARIDERRSLHLHPFREGHPQEESG